ncbi:MAG TPA: RNA methyltransferase, partial [Erysipelotrichaceae bacterium]|nr:RNA methyltransferase [Erysipelotrichaceae bacterium]
IADLCDERLYIPINNMESLNVGIAAAIVMYTYREE